MHTHARLYYSPSSALNRSAWAVEQTREREGEKTANKRTHLPINRIQKCSELHNRGENCYTLKFWVNTRRRSQWCSQNLRRPFSVRQRSQRCGQNLHGPFLRAILPMTVGLGTWATAGSRETKGLITPPPRWVSVQLLYIWGSARRLSQWSCHNLQ